MSYLSYLKRKLKAEETPELLDNAIKYLGGGYPENDSHHKGFEIVDNWIDKVLAKWNIEFKILNLSQSKFLGKLEPKQGGFIINLNKNLFSTQRRFIIAHEIAHILSYNTTSKWPVCDVAHSKMEENYCDRFARAILLPKSLINLERFDLANIDRAYVDLIKVIWPDFKVSPWQIIKKIFEDTDSHSFVAIMWEYFPRESCLRIVEHQQPPNVFIPKNDRIFLDNLLRKKETNLSPELAFNSNDIFQGDDVIEIGSLYKKKLFSTTFPIRTKSAVYIMQIIKTSDVSQLNPQNSLKE